MRAKTERVIRAAYAIMPEFLGVRVGMLCVRGGVPLTLIQGLAKVSVPTAYRWVQGLTDPTSEPLLNKLRRIEWTLEAALKGGVLPMADKFDPAPLLPYWKQSLTAVKRK